MTVETRTLFQLSDVEAVEFECRKCHAKVIRKISGFKSPPAVCGNCGEQWFVDGAQAVNELQYFLHQLERFTDDEKEKFDLRLEVKGASHE